MAIQAQSCVCRDCEQAFIFTPEQQKEFKLRGFGAPTRCPDCHQRRVARRLRGRSGEGPVYAATCSTCGQEARLPFKPSGTRAIHCDACFRGRSQGSQVTPELAVTAAPGSAPVVESSCGFDIFGLSSQIERALREGGFSEPTPVQSAAIPVALTGADIIATAQTGTGKTAAFLLPILQRLVTSPASSRGTRTLILTPTRELAEQITVAARKLGRYTGVRTASVYGGVRMDPQEKALRTGVEIIVACPGRLLDHMDRGNTSFGKVDTVVLDEADRMLDMGFLPSIKRILASLPEDRQTMLFSATFAPEVEKLARASLRNPQKLCVDTASAPGTIAHALYPCPQHLKTPLVLALLKDTATKSVLIFTRTKHRANRVAQQLGHAGHSASALHSNKTQGQRQRTMDDFRSGRCHILVATDIAARGLDISTISHVVNYDIPDTPDAYIHRIGRTGRAHRDGDAITLVAPQDHASLWAIEKALGERIERRKLEGFDYRAKDETARRSTTPPLQTRSKAPSRPRSKRLVAAGRS